MHHAAVHVAQHAARQDRVEQLGAVAGRHRPRQRDRDVELARHEGPAPRGRDRGDERERGTEQQDARVEGAQAVEHRTAADLTDHEHEDEGTREPTPRGPGERPHAATSPSAWTTRSAVTDHPSRTARRRQRGGPEPLAERGIGQPAPQRARRGRSGPPAAPPARAGRRPVGSPSASRTPPTSVATTGRPWATASVSDHAVGLRAARQHEQVRTGVRRLEVRAAERTGEQIRSATPSAVAARRSRDGGLRLHGGASRRRSTSTAGRGGRRGRRAGGPGP